jgi:hypothetical protein
LVRFRVHSDQLFLSVPANAPSGLRKIRRRSARENDQLAAASEYRE